MKTYNAQQVGMKFNLSTSELYAQLRPLGIIGGSQNRPADKYLEAGYFVDLRVKMNTHMKFDMTQKGLGWLKASKSIVSGDPDIKRECYHCKRKRFVTLLKVDGNIRRTCAACAEKLAAKENGSGTDVPVMSKVRRNRVASLGANSSYYGGP